uniref:Fibronectin type-III domain-containing protein n=1 Tax=Schistosoma haematobium TaxID=6185 RepID=A0A094ZRU0_SCHHA
MPIKSKNLSEKADDGYSLLSYFKVLPGYSDNRRLKATWDWSSMEVAQNLLQQAKILYYNDLDVDLIGQEIIQDYQIKEFDLTNLHPDTKYLICFRVTRKRFVSSSIPSSSSSSSPSLYIQSNGTIATLTPTFKSSIHHQNKTNIINNMSDNLQYKQKINNPMISYQNISFLSRSHRQQSSINIPKLDNEYVAEMKCQVTFTRFLHWTAVLCSLIGIVIALLLSIMIFSILKSRAYKIKQSERKMYFNQKGELLLIGHKKVGDIHDDDNDDDEEENNLLNSNKLGKMKDKNIKLNIPSEVKEDNEMNISKQQLEDWENTLKNIETDNTIIIEKDNMLNSITKPVTYSINTDITNDINHSNNNNNESTMNNIKIQKTSESILPNPIMESKRTVSFKDDTTTTTSSTTNTTTIITTTNNIANTPTLNNNIDSNNNSNNINDGIRQNSILESNNSNQLTSLDSNNDELNNNDFIKPISISLTESSLIHFRHHIPEYTQMDNNNNNRLQSNNPSSYFEIKSPLLKEYEQKSFTSMHPVVNENENNNNTTDDNPQINDNRMIQIVTNKLNTNEVTVQLPITPNNSPINTIGKNSTVSIPGISTSDNDGKHFISNNENWFITPSGSTSNVLVDKNEQKSIFCTQIIETL